MRVLHIEDEEYNAYIVKRRLKSVTELRLASSLKEARYMLRVYSFDVLLVDLNLQDSKGMDTLAALSIYGLPLVVLSGDDDSDTVSQASRLGAADYIRKNDLLHIDLVARLEAACQPRERLFASTDISLLKSYLACPSCVALAV